MLIYAQLVLAMLFYGISFVSTKVVLAAYGPITVLAIRLIISVVFLVALDRVLPDRMARTTARNATPAGAPVSDASPDGTASDTRLRWPLRRDLGPLLLVTFFQPILYFLAENNGLRLVSASIASIVVATIPVFTPILARPFLGERIRPLTVIGLVLSLLGVALIVFERRVDSQFTPLGLALMFVAVFAAVGYTVAVKSVSIRYRPLTIVKLQSLFGLPVAMALAFATEGVPSLNPGIPVIAHLVFLGIFPSSVAFIFLGSGIRRLGASRANVFVNLVPAFTAIVSWLFLGELFTAQKLAGMAVVVAGVLAAQFGQMRAARR